MEKRHQMARMRLRGTWLFLENVLRLIILLNLPSNPRNLLRLLSSISILMVVSVDYAYLARHVIDHGEREREPSLYIEIYEPILRCFHSFLN